MHVQINLIAEGLSKGIVLSPPLAMVQVTQSDERALCQVRFASFTGCSFYPVPQAAEQRTRIQPKRGETAPWDPSCGRPSSHHGCRSEEPAANPTSWFLTSF